ncbi:MAG: hypothetical protein U9N55_04590 [candidate division Zixibacteria bacterium]|nr:hypothetical protein [candidate division Zixibacteria bacterium]
MDFRKPKFLFPIVSLALAVYYTFPFLLNLHNWGIRDWDLFTCIAAIPASSVLDYGQFPFWNPYMGGGNILFHHPEVGVLTPFFLLYLLFGSVVGLKLQVLICYFLGFWGSQKLFNKLGMSLVVSIVSSVAYFGSVHFALHFAEGHIPFTHYAFLPWFLYFVLRAGRNRIFKRESQVKTSKVSKDGFVEHSHRMLSIFWAGVMLALMILGNGAAIPLMYTMLFSFMLIGLRSVQNRTIYEFQNLVLATLTGFGLAAVKMLPMIVYLVQNEWAGNPNESIPLSALTSIFFGLKHSLFAHNFPEQYWAWHEYGAYLSPFLVVSAVYVLVRCFRASIIWVILAVFSLLLGLGDFGFLSPWSLLAKLPGFSSARCTGRAFQFVILSVAVLGGFGFDWLRHSFEKTRFRKVSATVLWLAMAVVVCTNLVFAWPILARAHTWPACDVHRSPVFRNVVDEESLAYENFLANRGSLITPWLSAYYPSRGMVGPDSVVYSEFVSKGEAEIIHRKYTPNVITYEFNGIKPGQMVIGMGYDPGWKASDNRTLYAVDGLITFDFDKGNQIVVLTYQSPYFYYGLFLSLASLVFLAVIGIKKRKLTMIKT